METWKGYLNSHVNMLGIFLFEVANSLFTDLLVYNIVLLQENSHNLNLFLKECFLNPFFWLDQILLESVFWGVKPEF